MKQLFESFKAFCQNEEGLTVVEYVIGAGLLVGVVSLVFGSMGNQLLSKFSSIINEVPP